MGKEHMTQLTETKKLLVKILETPFNKELKVPCRLGYGEVLVQRCRVELSRVRKRLEKSKIKVPGFKLKATVFNKLNLQDANLSCDVITFKRMRPDDVVVDLSEIDKALNEIVRAEIKEEEAREAEHKGKLIIRTRAHQS